MIKSRYYNEQELQQIVSETESQIERMHDEARLNEGLARLEQYMREHSDEVSRDPMVQALRRIQPQGAAPALVAQPTAPAPVAPAPSGYKSRAQLERERPWLAPRKPEVESVIDPYAGRKANRIRIG